MTPQDFDYLRKVLRERSGLVLSAEKQYLAESRLLPVARRHGMTTLSELIAALKLRPISALASDVVEAMTTNETFFFRDKTPFAHFRDTMMPALDELESVHLANGYRRERIRVVAQNGGSKSEAWVYFRERRFITTIHTEPMPDYQDRRYVVRDDRD